MIGASRTAQGRRRTTDRRKQSNPSFHANFGDHPKVFPSRKYSKLDGPHIDRAPSGPVHTCPPFGRRLQSCVTHGCHAALKSVALGRGSKSCPLCVLCQGAIAAPHTAPLSAAPQTSETRAQPLGETQRPKDPKTQAHAKALSSFL